MHQFALFFIGIASSAWISFTRTVAETQDTCKPIVSCQATLQSSGSFSAMGPLESGSCVCHFEEVGEVGVCVTKNCKVDRTVTPLWGINSGSGKSVNGADTTTCQTPSNGIAEVASGNSCGLSTNTLKWNVYSDANCSTWQTVWTYKVTCGASLCADGVCVR